MNLFDYKEKYIGRTASGIQHIHFVVGFVYFGIAVSIGRTRRFPRFMDETAGERCVLIWPCQPARVFWPPSPIDQQGGIEGMFEAFSRAAWM